jgi:deoxyribodipyrimidine photo-lyase
MFFLTVMTMVSSQRIKHLNAISYTTGSIVYWMSRDQRVEDNWALLYAQELAEKTHQPLAVIFCLRKKFGSSTERLVEFMLTGLSEVEASLKEKNIPFFFLLGEIENEIPQFIKKHQIGALVSDFSPLRYNREWKNSLAKKIEVPFFEVDTHNIIPVWEASPKQEYGAYTIRPKIHRLLQTYLTEFPALKKQSIDWPEKKEKTDWKKVRQQIDIDHTVQAVEWIKSGEKAAGKMLNDFLQHRLSHYLQDRNDPTKDAQSNLSPYIHFGQLSTERIALEVGKIPHLNTAKEAFLEELIVRKELSDNYCYYNPNYDNPAGFPDWAKKTLKKHADDKKEVTYTLKQLEAGETHNELWNAAQMEMIKKGKMHGYLRMYWAKKIFEWSKDVTTAQKQAIYLNDKYFLDGRDPNGYVGIAWSMGGVHDRAWFERPIFGQIRYMNYNGAKNKFDIKKYIEQVHLL